MKIIVARWGSVGGFILAADTCWVACNKILTAVRYALPCLA